MNTATAAPPAVGGAPALVSLLMIAVILGLIAYTSGTMRYQAPAPGGGMHGAAAGRSMVFNDAEKHGRDERMAEIKVRFEEAVAMLHAKQYEYALPPLHRLLQLDPRMPEAYVNMGYALLGLKRYQAAERFFETAVDLRPYQDDACWGLAEALEGENDLGGALGAMRTYIHLAKPNDPYDRRARSAIWEWEYRLGRGPLPKNEARWLKTREQQWDDRNSPKRDLPDRTPVTVPIS